MAPKNFTESEATRIRWLRRQAAQQGWILRKGRARDRGAWYVVDARLNAVVAELQSLNEVAEWLAR